MEKKCSLCGKIKLVFLRKDTRKYRSWVSIADGSMWINNRCRSCVRELDRKRPKYERNPGHKDKQRCGYKYPGREVSRLPRVIKAVNSEKTAQIKMEELGFCVERTTNKGPDLIFSINGSIITVEVKSVISRKNWTSHIVAPVKPRRLNDHLIAIVLPSGSVYLEDMQSHLRKCAKSGARSVTDLVRSTTT